VTIGTCHCATPKTKLQEEIYITTSQPDQVPTHPTTTSLEEITIKESYRRPQGILEGLCAQTAWKCQG